MTLRHNDKTIIVTNPSLLQIGLQGVDLPPKIQSNIGMTILSLLGCSLS
jgi:hypothetical protein